MTTSHGCILFCDISDSTSFFRVFGEAAAQALIAHSLNKAKLCLDPFNARIVDEIGDEIMVYFEAMEDAAHAALALMDCAESLRVENSVGHVQFRVGLYKGEVTWRGDKVFGDVVHTAKRMVDYAKPMQMLTDGAFEADLHGCGVFSRFVANKTLKGSQRQIAIHELLRLNDELTIATAMSDAKADRFEKKLLLSFNGMDWELSSSSAPLRFGRADYCDIVIENPKVSRAHGVFEWRDGRCYLIDHSTNGCFILPDDATVATLCRQANVELTESGLIGFDTDDINSHGISYRLV